MFTKKRNTSRHGWHLILRDMGLATYVTPYQAQKKWNNLWSRYKLAKRAQAEGSVEEDPNGVWPFFTLLDAIATGKTVAITNPGFTLQVATSTNEPTALPSLTNTSSGSANNAPVNEINAEPPAKKSKLEETNNSNQWDGTEDYKQQVVELLQANLQQLDEVRQTVETQGQAIVSMLSQLIHVISSGNKSSPSNSNIGASNSRIDEAITATIREIGITQENL